MEVEDLKDIEGVDEMDLDPPYPTSAPSVHHLDKATLFLPVKSEGVVKGTALKPDILLTFHLVISSFRIILPQTKRRVWR
jgi:hypothetical protein